MSNEITDPKAREQAKQILGALSNARITGYRTGLLTSAECDLITAVQLRLNVRLGEITVPITPIPGIHLIRGAAKDIERQAADTARATEAEAVTGAQGGAR